MLAQHSVCVGGGAGGTTIRNEDRSEDSQLIFCNTAQQECTEEVTEESLGK